MQEIASIAFSSDSKILAAQGGAPEWNLVIWSWENSKVLASVKTGNATGSPVNQVPSLMLPLMPFESMEIPKSCIADLSSLTERYLHRYCLPLAALWMAASSSVLWAMAFSKPTAIRRTRSSPCPPPWQSGRRKTTPAMPGLWKVRLIWG